MTHGPWDAKDYTHGQSKFDFTVHICYSKNAADPQKRKFRFFKKSNPSKYFRDTC